MCSQLHLVLTAVFALPLQRVCMRQGRKQAIVRGMHELQKKSGARRRTQLADTTPATQKWCSALKSGTAGSLRSGHLGTKKKSKERDNAVEYTQCTELCGCAWNVLRTQTSGTVHAVDDQGREIEFIEPGSGRRLKSLTDKVKHMLALRSGPKSNRWAPWKKKVRGQEGSNEKGKMRAGSRLFVDHCYMTLICSICLQPLDQDSARRCMTCKRSYHTRCTGAIERDVHDHFLCKHCE